MQNNGTSLPDSVIPYCRTLFDRLQSDIEENEERRDAIIWIVDLFRMEQTLACKVFNEREKRTVTSANARAATVPADDGTQNGRNVIDLTFSDSDEAGLMSAPAKTPTKHPLPPRPSDVTAAAPPDKAVTTKAAQKQSHVPDPPSTFAPPRRKAAKDHAVTMSTATRALHSKDKARTGTVDYLQPVPSTTTLHRTPMPAVPRGTLRLGKREFKPCVGDWKCALCKHWQKRMHDKCRTEDPATDTGSCDGSRLLQSDVLCVQDDDGEHYHRRMGKYKGDWYCGQCEHWIYAYMERCRSCTTSCLDAEYVMGDEDGLKDRPPTPPRTDRTGTQKRKSFFVANGRFMDHSKPKYR